MDPAMNIDPKRQMMIEHVFEVQWARMKPYLDANLSMDRLSPADIKCFADTVAVLWPYVKHKYQNEKVLLLLAKMLKLTSPITEKELEDASILLLASENANANANANDPNRKKNEENRVWRYLKDTGYNMQQGGDKPKQKAKKPKSSPTQRSKTKAN